MTRQCKLIVLSMYDIPEDAPHLIPAEVIVEEATDLKDVIFNNEVRSIMSGFGF